MNNKIDEYDIKALSDTLAELDVQESKQPQNFDPMVYDQIVTDSGLDFYVPKDKKKIAKKVRKKNK
jgi:hypothetical protein